MSFTQNVKYTYGVLDSGGLGRRLKHKGRPGLDPERPSLRACLDVAPRYGPWDPS
jgi:hypothetical protein